MAVTLFGAAPAQPSPGRMQEVVALFQQGEHARAEAAARALSSAHPRHPFGWTMLAAALRAQHRTQDALPALRRAAELQPRDARAQANLANALRDHGDREAAIAAYRQALKLDPALPGARFNLANLQHDLGQLDQAEQNYRLALQAEPGRADIASNRAQALQELGRLEESLQAHDTAVALAPDQPALHTNRADALHDLRRFDEAAAGLRQALALNPGFAPAHQLLGTVLQDVGDADGSLAHLRRAVELEPDDLGARSNLLFFLNYRLAHDADESLREARAYGAAVLRHWERLGMPGQAAPARGPSVPPARLRVGLLSADLRRHPVGYFLDGVVQAVAAHGMVDLVGLPTQIHADDLTARLRQACRGGWVSLAGLGDAAAAEAVAQLQLDVVLDLSGHTAGNRLPLFARRMAPVQASWLGYFATTGAPGMDYLLADAASLPPALEPAFTEAIWRLPETRLCFTPPADAPGVASLPGLKTGAITFGNFGNLHKLNDAVLAAWARVLEALPGSRLLLKAKQLADAGARARCAERCAAAGIAADRLVLEGPTDRADYLAAYARVDIVLDTFPFNGGTTTAEALWMGVPVLTLAGDRFVARQGAALLHAAGLPDWVASSADDFVARAEAHSGNLDRLARWRVGARESLRGTALYDTARFARHWEAALRGMVQAARPAG